MAQLRKLNEYGMNELRQFLATVAEFPDTPLPTGLLTSEETSESLPITLEIEAKTFASRMEAAQYLYGVFSAGASGLDRIPEVWSWLSCFFFDQLCPKKNGVRKPGEEARWIPSGHAFRYYRHLLAGPYLIYKSFRDEPSCAGIVLCGAVDTPGDFVGQLAARQDFVQNKAVMGAATTLYLNSESGKPKRGASPTERKPGTLRRFVDVVNQLDLTWDLHSMATGELVKKLPGEFAVYM